MQREIALFTLDGVTDASITSHYFSTEDKLGLSMFRYVREPSEDVVMIVHGLTTSTDMFIMPEHMNLVQWLLDRGYEVWTLDYRMSNRHSYNLVRHRFTLDEVALWDFAPALDMIRTVSGEPRIHVIAHCLGAASFAMGLFGKAFDVRSAILNSVALTPRVPKWSGVKLRMAPFMVEYVLGRPYLSPTFAQDPGLTVGKLLAKANSLVHRECDVSACHMLSLMWGAGRPALYSHENLHPISHERGGDLYGPSALHYYRHVSKMVSENNTAVKYDPADRRLAALPNNYFDHVRDVETPVLFMTGENNKVFADSNIECHRRMEAIVPGRHELWVIPGYGHQDPFMGKSVDVDVFPRLLEFIEKHSN